MGGPGPGANPAFRADLARSVRLLRAFRTEQADPSGYYTVLAADTVRQLAQYTSLSGQLVLDVGGGPGFFVRAFRAAGAQAFGADTDRGELAACGPPERGSVVGSALEPGHSPPVSWTCVSPPMSWNSVPDWQAC